MASFSRRSYWQQPQKTRAQCRKVYSFFTLLSSRFQDNFLSGRFNACLLSSWHNQDLSEWAAEQPRATGLCGEQSWEMRLFLTIFFLHIKCKLFFLLWTYIGWWIDGHVASHLFKNLLRSLFPDSFTGAGQNQDGTWTCCCRFKTHYLVLFIRTTHFYLLTSNCNCTDAVFLRDCQNAPSPVHGRELNCHPMIWFKGFFAYSLNHNQSTGNRWQKEVLWLKQQLYKTLNCEVVWTWLLTKTILSRIFSLLQHTCREKLKLSNLYRCIAHTVCNVRAVRRYILSLRGPSNFWAQGTSHLLSESSPFWSSTSSHSNVEASAALIVWTWYPRPKCQSHLAQGTCRYFCQCLQQVEPDASTVPPAQWAYRVSQHVPPQQLPCSRGSWGSPDSSSLPTQWGIYITFLGYTAVFPNLHGIALKKFFSNHIF